MSSQNSTKSFESSEVAFSEIDLASMVGHQIILFSDQFPGKRLTAKILATEDEIVTIGRGGSNCKIDDLVSNQSVFAQIEYRGQRVAVRGLVKRSATGKCLLELDDTIVPLQQRQFNRINIEGRAKMAVVPVSGLSSTRISRLRWTDNHLVNVSGGGALIIHSSMLSAGSNLLMSMDCCNIPFPKLLTASVRHAVQHSDNRYRIGLEYVLQETSRKVLSEQTIRHLPASALEYSSRQRQKINQTITNLMQEQRDKR